MRLCSDALFRAGRRVSILQLDAIWIRKEHCVVALAVVVVLRRRIEDVRSEFLQLGVEPVDVLTRLRPQRQVMQPARIPVVLPRRIAPLGLEQRDARIALVAESEPGPGLARALQREAAMAEKQFIERPRLRRIRNGEIEMMEKIRTHFLHQSFLHPPFIPAKVGTRERLRSLH